MTYNNTKQLADTRVDIIVNEYSTHKLRNVIIGQRVHAKVPERLLNGGVKT
jgi:hypothetical protein